MPYVKSVMSDRILEIFRCSPENCLNASTKSPVLLLVIFPADTELLMLTSFVWDSYLPRHSERKWVRDIGDFLTDCIEAVPACEINAYYEKLTKLAKAKECSQ